MRSDTCSFRRRIFGTSRIFTAGQRKQLNWVPTLLRNGGLVVEGTLVHLGKGGQILSHIEELLAGLKLLQRTLHTKSLSLRRQRKRCRSKQYIIKQTNIHTQNSTKTDAVSGVCSPAFPLVNQQSAF
jgi:hypothetical protein